MASAQIQLLRAEALSFHAEWKMCSGWRIVFRDIPKRVAAKEEVKRYSQELERSNRDLQDFAFVAFHEIQEPLPRNNWGADVQAVQKLRVSATNHSQLRQGNNKQMFVQSRQNLVRISSSICSRSTKSLLVCTVLP